MLTERSTRPPTIRFRKTLILTAGVIAAAIGGALALSPSKLGVASLGIAGLTAIVAVGLHQGLSAGRAFVLGTILISGLIDLPRHITIGGVSGTAALTYAYLAVALFLLISHASLIRPMRQLWPLAVFVAWGLTSLLWGGVSQQGIQNLMVVGGFVAVVTLVHTLTADDPHLADTLRWSATVTTWVALGLFSLSLVPPLSGYLAFGPRSFALFSLVLLAWHLAAQRYRARSSGWAVAASFALVLASLSRLAVVAALGMLVISRIDPKARSKGIFKMVAFAALAAGMVWMSITYIGPFRDRFVTGDVVEIAGSFSVNTSGRSVLWPETWYSAQESPLTGKGAGSSAQLLEKYGEEHPHNDYLRFLHDLGIFGLGLWLLGIYRVMRASWRSWRDSHRADTSSARVHLASLLALMGLSIGMITDNPIAFVFIMIPIAVFVGTSLGLSDGNDHSSPQAA